jgi:hypothetical protein
LLRRVIAPTRADIAPVVRWLRSLGEVRVVGLVEATAATELASRDTCLTHGIDVPEIDRPERFARRRRGQR